MNAQNISTKKGSHYSNFYNVLKNFQCGIAVLEEQRQIVSIGECARDIFGLIKPINTSFDPAHVFPKKVAEILKADCIDDNLLKPPEKTVKINLTHTDIKCPICLFQDTTIVR